MICDKTISTLLIHPVGRLSNSDSLPTAYVVRGKVMFSVCVSVHICAMIKINRSRQGVPHPGPGGRGGTPSRSRWGGTPSRSRWGEGVPHPRSRWVVPHPRSRQGGTHPGYPQQGAPTQGTPQQGGAHLGYPLAGGAPTQGSPLQQEQHSVYLLHGSRYASCVQAGGLSCS